MAQYDLIIQMPLGELLTYYHALNAICEKYEAELRPLFNSHNPKDKLRWVELNNELQHAKLYFDVVLNALKYKSFHGLDEYNPKEVKKLKETVKKPIKKKPITPSQSGRNVKKK